MTGPLENGSGAGAALPQAAPRRVQLGRVMAAVLAAASVGLAAWVIVRHLNKDNPESLDRMTYWKCLNVEGCGKDFTMTIAEFFAMIEQGPPEGQIPELTLAELNAQSLCGLSPDMPLWCPHCGSYIIARGYPCPHCSAIVRVGAHGVLPDVCASCGRNPGAPMMTPLSEDEPPKPDA